MRWIVVVNRVDELVPSMTTTQLAAAAADRGHATWLAGVDGLSVDNDGAVRAIAVRQTADGHGAPTSLVLGRGDLVVIRTNPARDERWWAHETALQMLVLAQRAGARVVNDPQALLRASSKLYLMGLPAAVRPHSLVSRDVAAIEAFVRTAPGPSVLKPVRGTRGRDVFKVQPDGSGNLRAIIDVIVRDGHCQAQHFVPEAVDGDVRMILVDGRILEVGGAPAVVRRVPGTGDFRSNVAVGGRPAATPWTPALARVAELAGPGLAADGMWMVGLDVIGDRVVEANVFSPGGLQDAGAFAGVDFVGAVIDALQTVADA